MKKTFLAFVILLTIALTTFAGDGQMGATRSCPQGQTCLFSLDSANQSEIEKNWFESFVSDLKFLFKF